MQYWLLVWRTRSDERDGLSITEIGLCRVGSASERLHAKLRSDFTGSYDVWLDDVEQATSVQSFAELWIAVRSRISAAVTVVEHIAAKRADLDTVVEEYGYSPLEESRVIDCHTLARVAEPTLARRGLADLSRHFDLAVAADELSAVAEAAVLCEVFGRLVDKVWQFPLATLQVLVQAPTLANEALRDMLAQAMVDHMQTGYADTEDAVKVIDGLAFMPAVCEDRDPAEPFASTASARQDLAEHSLALLHGALAKATQLGFERRVGQERMIRHVADALTGGRHLVVEAGTGTGKSLAYLLPSILFALETGERVVVATHTVALQEQLRKQDLQMIRETLPVAFQSTVLKGRNHYVCLRKVAQFTHALTALRAEEASFVVAMISWLTTTVAGDREEVAIEAGELEQWRSVQSESESCLNRRCSFFKDCYFFRARQRALQADLVITNHSLVLSDIMADHRVLPPHQHLVIDEAHHLEDQATKQLGAEVSEDDLLRLLDRLVGGRVGVLRDLEHTLARLVSVSHAEWQPYLAILQKIYRIVGELSQASKVLFAAVHDDLAQAGVRTERRISKDLLDDASYQTLLEGARRQWDLRQLLGGALAEYDRLTGEIELDAAVLGRMEDAIGHVRHLFFGMTVCLETLLVAYDEDKFVGWIARRSTRAKGSASFHLAPLSVAQPLHDELFAKRRTVIFTSATLSVGESFQYFCSQVGLLAQKREGHLDELIVASPFRYDRQALLCVPTDLPSAKDQAAFTQAVGRAVTRIAQTANGRTLVLFTSYQMLETVYRSEHGHLGRLGIKLLAQGYDDHRRSRLIENFKNAERAVLFGVNSFWEGIDIRGDDLSCLIIVKLPFDVPTHPVIEARCERLRQAGKQPFYEYSVPQAVIRFTQGFGRLIRSGTDRGAVFVLDNRILNSSYGRLFIKSLPGPTVLVGPLEETRARALAFFSAGNHSL